MESIREDLVEIQPISWLSSAATQTFVLRLDKIHPEISGNKWYKLKEYLAAAQTQGKHHIVSFGGAYSNHLLALAAACKQLGLNATGMVRGESPKEWGETLQNLKVLGMDLVFLSRDDYAAKRLPMRYQSERYFIIPEGGYGPLGAQGAATIPFSPNDFDAVCCAVGTGTMMAGLIMKMSATKPVIGFSVLKGHCNMEAEVRQCLPSNQVIDFHGIQAFHGGGYAKRTPALIDFMNTFHKNSGVPTDFVYTGKLFLGVHTLLQQGYFDGYKKLLVIHSGGLQGNRSLPKGTLIF